MDQEGIVCLECNTLNETGWSFCQQCGKKLVQPQAPPPQPPAQPPQRPSEIPLGLKTVPEKRPVVDQGFAQNFDTVMEKPSHGLRTNADNPTPLERELKTVVAQPPPVDQEARTLTQETPVIEPEVPREIPVQQPRSAAPANIREAAASEPPPPVTKSGAAPPKIAAPPRVAAKEPARQSKPAAPAPTPPVRKPSAPASESRHEPASEHGESMSGVLCTQCGQATNVGSSFCANCGAPVTYGKTMVISSQLAAPPKGRLHLVMEGGQPGDVYELDDETVIGRSNGQITFPHDGFMSGRHARIEQRGASFMLSDEGSRNGTFIKIKGDVELLPGDTILVGKQLFRFELVDEAGGARSEDSGSQPKRR